MTETAVDLTGTWDIDPTHTRIGFAVRHAMVATVRGNFAVFSGVLHLDHAEPGKSSAEVEIDAASINTGNQQRDDHLRSPDFLDVANYPTITFQSTSAEVKGGDEYLLHGDLTIKGVSKPVSVEFEKTGTSVDPWGGHRVGFEGRTKVNRKEWGLSFNAALETGGVLISEKVTLEFDIAAVRRAS
jgi:polyisoprenoid-binding protein YceI